MKWLQFVLLLVGPFFIAISITTSADARAIRVISRPGNWAVQSGCTSVYAMTNATSASEGFGAGLSISSNNGSNSRPVISVYWGGDLKLSEKSQFKYRFGDNEFASDGWICEKHRCSPKDGDSAAKIIEQLLANEGRLVIAITDKNKVIEATFDTTGLNESYQDLLKHRR